jgi:hypothetical protein
MDECYWHPSSAGASPATTTTTVAPDDLTPTTRSKPLADRADCCSAQPLFRVVMAATADRPHPAELLMCGHHLRASQGALLTRGVSIYDAQGHLTASA